MTFPPGAPQGIPPSIQRRWDEEAAKSAAAAQTIAQTTWTTPKFSFSALPQAVKLASEVSWSVTLPLTSPKVGSTASEAENFLRRQNRVDFSDSTLGTLRVDSKGDFQTPAGPSTESGASGHIPNLLPYPSTPARIDFGLLNRSFGWAPPAALGVPLLARPNTLVPHPSSVIQDLDNTNRLVRTLPTVPILNYDQLRKPDFRAEPPSVSAASVSEGLELLSKGEPPSVSAASVSEGLELLSKGASWGHGGPVQTEDLGLKRRITDGPIGRGEARNETSWGGAVDDAYSQAFSLEGVRWLVRNSMLPWWLKKDFMRRGPVAIQDHFNHIARWYEKSGLDKIANAYRIGAGEVYTLWPKFFGIQ